MAATAANHQSAAAAPIMELDINKTKNYFFCKQMPPVHQRSAAAEWTHVTTQPKDEI